MKLYSYLLSKSSQTTIHVYFYYTITQVISCKNAWLLSATWLNAKEFLIICFFIHFLFSFHHRQKKNIFILCVFFGLLHVLHNDKHMTIHIVMFYSKSIFWSTWSPWKISTAIHFNIHKTKHLFWSQSTLTSNKQDICPQINLDMSRIEVKALFRLD